MIVELVGGTSHQHRRVLDRELARHAEQMTPARLRELARSLREQTGPIDPDRRATLARQSRHLVFAPATNGMATLTVHGPAPDLLCAGDRIARCATTLRERELSNYREQVAAVRRGTPREPGESAADRRARIRARVEDLVRPRTLAQLRADVAVSLLLEGESLVAPVVTPESGESLLPERLPTLPVTEVPEGIRGEILLTMPLGTLLGLQDTLQRDPQSPGWGTIAPNTLVGDRYARLHGYGAIDADSARRIAVQCAMLRPVLTDPETGAAHCVGRSSYVPPDALRRTLQVRDEHCRFPGCAQEARRCDLDHSIAWSAGGATNAGNLAHLCREHHDLKHHAVSSGQPGGTGWSLVRNDRGQLLWSSPSGRRYYTEVMRLSLRDGPPLEIPGASTTPPF